MPNLMHEFAYVKRYYCLVKYMNLPSAKNKHKNARTYWECTKVELRLVSSSSAPATLIRLHNILGYLF